VKRESWTTLHRFQNDENNSRTRSLGGREKDGMTTTRKSETLPVKLRPKVHPRRLLAVVRHAHQRTAGLLCPHHLPFLAPLDKTSALSTHCLPISSWTKRFRAIWLRRQYWRWTPCRRRMDQPKSTPSKTKASASIFTMVSVGTSGFGQSLDKHGRRSC